MQVLVTAAAATLHVQLAAPAADASEAVAQLAGTAQTSRCREHEMEEEEARLSLQLDIQELQVAVTDTCPLSKRHA